MELEGPFRPSPSAFPCGPSACTIPPTDSWRPLAAGPQTHVSRPGQAPLPNPRAQPLPLQWPRSVPLSILTPKTQTSQGGLGYTLRPPGRGEYMGGIRKGGSDSTWQAWREVLSFLGLLCLQEPLWDRCHTRVRGSNGTKEMDGWGRCQRWKLGRDRRCGNPRPD